MHITEVIKQEVIAPDIVKYQGVIVRPQRRIRTWGRRGGATASVICPFQSI